MNKLHNIFLSYPCLYDRTNPHFGTKYVKSKVLKEILVSLKRGGGCKNISMTDLSQKLRYFQRLWRTGSFIYVPEIPKSTANIRTMQYLSRAKALALDMELLNEYKFSVDQLIELAGLSVATSVAKTFSPATHKSALVICGPGNNGGDGLVAARHMALFGYEVTVYYPKCTPKPLYKNLLEQCKRFGVDIVDKLPPPKVFAGNAYKVLVDALLGLGFKPPVSEDLKPALDALIDSIHPFCSIDVPSGWDVDKGPSAEGKSLKPAVLISLSAPKMCARPEILNGAHHFLSGRFLPPGIIQKYNLRLPSYPDQDQIIQLSCTGSIAVEMSQSISCTIGIH